MMKNTKKQMACLVIFASLFGYVNAVAAEEHDHHHATLHAEKGVASSKLFPAYARLCDLTKKFRDVNVPRKPNPNAKPNVNSIKKEDLVAPMQVFDNLYFLGTARVSAWLYGTEEGYILIDTLNNNEEAEEVIIGGMKELGLDPEKIKYLLIGHAHGDHYGGHRFLKNTYKLPIVMSGSDWELASRLGMHPRFGPAPIKDETDMAVSHGDVLTAGVTKLDIHVTPGHTMGTISPVFTVYDNGKPYRAALWGGTGYNFGVKPEQFAAYANSARTFKENAQAEGVEVFFSNHGQIDGSLEKMKALSARAPGEDHPFVMGVKALEVYDVLEQCALAQYDRIQDGDYPSPEK